MFKITFTTPDRHGLEAQVIKANSASEFFAMGLRPRVQSWEHFNEKGQRTGGGKGVNACATLCEYSEML